MAYLEEEMGSILKRYWESENSVGFTIKVHLASNDTKTIRLYLVTFSPLNIPYITS